MAEEFPLPVGEKGRQKRKMGKRKHPNYEKKKLRMSQGTGDKVKVSNKMKKLFRKRAREYDSDDDEQVLSLVGREENPEDVQRGDTDSFGESGSEGSEGEDNEVEPGIMKFAEGCRAFKTAFRNIIKKNVSEDSLGPVLSGHKQLVAKKLAEEAAERNVMRESKKEKRLVAEKGHVKPLNYMDSHEKLLIGIATKGVVKLFNAVNKAQHAQKGLNPSRSKDEKVIGKRRKRAFFSELSKAPSALVLSNKGNMPSGPLDDEVPAWAPLCDNYMLSNPKLKDWDKIPDVAVADDFGNISKDGSSDSDGDEA